MTPTPEQPVPRDSSPSGRVRFGRRQRLTKAAEYEAVYAAKVRKVVGPLIVFAAPNGLKYPRIGLAVGRRVGNAVTRNAVKRRLREAFRLDQESFPLGLDFVITVRSHDAATLDAYRAALSRAIDGLRVEWDRRHRRHTESPTDV